MGTANADIVQVSDRVFSMTRPRHLVPRSPKPMAAAVGNGFGIVAPLLLV